MWVYYMLNVRFLHSYVACSNRYKYFAWLIIVFRSGPSSLGRWLTWVGNSGSLVTSLRHSLMVWYSPCWQFGVIYISLFFDKGDDVLFK